MFGKRGRGMGIIVAIFLIIMVPFFIFGKPIESWVQLFFQNTSNRLWAFLVISILLMLDILIPVPSSLVSSTGGYLLGLVPGLSASWIGMTLGCWIGYSLGAKFGKMFIEKKYTSEELLQIEQLSRKWGDWAIIICRPIPVLAEMSVILAGVSQMTAKRFLFITALSNLGISLVYALIGTYSAHIESFLLAFAGAVIFPVLFMAISNWTKILRD